MVRKMLIASLGNELVAVVKTDEEYHALVINNGHDELVETKELHIFVDTPVFSY
jgi:hypothetical protein